MRTFRLMLGLTVAVVSLFTTGCSRLALPVVQAQDRMTPQPPTHPLPDVTLTPPAVSSLNGEYLMNAVCNTNAQLRVVKVTVTENKTLVDCTFRNERIGTEALTDRIRTAAPGQQTAFYLSDPNSRNEYRLLNVEGIALEPTWTLLKEGERLNFHLTFERIPDTMTQFHMIEGKVPSLSEDNQPLRNWTFMNLRLK